MIDLRHTEGGKLPLLFIYNFFLEVSTNDFMRKFEESKLRTKSCAELKKSVSVALDFFFHFFAKLYYFSKLLSETTISIIGRTAIKLS